MCALFPTDIDVAQDALHLFLGHLRAHHCPGIERVAGLNTFDSLHGTLDKALVDGFLNQDTRWACANLALVQSKHAQTFQGFVQEGIISLHHVFKEDVGALAAQLYRSGDQAVGCGVQDFTADGGGASEGDFGDALGVG